MDDLNSIIIVSDTFALCNAALQLFYNPSRKDIGLVIGLILAIFLPFAHMVQYKDYNPESIAFITNEISCRVLDIANQIDLFATSYKFVYLIKWALSFSGKATFNFSKKYALLFFLSLHFIWLIVTIACTEEYFIKNISKNSYLKTCEIQKLCHYTPIKIKQEQLDFFRSWGKNIFNTVFSSISVFVGLIYTIDKLRILETIEKSC